MQSQPRPDWVAKGNKFALPLHFSIQMYWSTRHKLSTVLFLAQPFFCSWLGVEKVHVPLAGVEKETQVKPTMQEAVSTWKRDSERRFHIRKLFTSNVIMIWNFQRMPDICVLAIKPHHLLPAHAGPSWWQSLSPPHRCGWWLWQPQPAPGHALPVAVRCAAASPSVPPGELWCQRFYGHIEKRSLSAGRGVKKRQR